MYAYENGLKRKNVGYARVETRNRQCKFTLHVQMAGQPDSIVPTYLIFRNNKDIGVVYLGDALLRNQLIDNKLIAKEADIIEAGKGLGKACGIILFNNSHQFCATYWDDEKVDVNDILEALKSKKNTQDKNSKETAEKLESELKEELEEKVVEVPAMEQEPVKVVEDSKVLEEALVESTEDKAEESFEKNAEDEAEEAFEENAEDEAEEALVENAEDEIEEALEENTEDQVEEALVENAEDVVEEVLVGSTEDKEDETLVESVEDEVKEALEKVTDNPVEEAINKNIESLQHKDDELSLYKLPGGYKFTQAVQRDNRAKIQADRQSDNKYFAPFTKINPFEDKAVVICAKMEPKDIGVLPKETWDFSNNSFLLHGYYNYKHIIFAKLMDQGRPHYILGVPGIFNNKEKFVARMFGFNNFKSAKKQTLRQGDFGYWYAVIKV